ncbi:MAG: delta-60 repeat domain-containing protein [Limisphaerales bacterium]
MTVQGDGKVVAGGAFNSPGASGVARLNIDGSLDTTFDAGAGPNGAVDQLLLLPSGDLLAAGNFTQFNQIPEHGLAVLLGGMPEASSIIKSFGFHSGQFQLVFSAPSGRQYQVESSTDLRAWTALSASATTGADTTFTDSGAAASRRFYRVKLQ